MANDELEGGDKCFGCWKYGSSIRLFDLIGSGYVVYVYFVYGFCILLIAEMLLKAVFEKCLAGAIGVADQYIDFLSFVKMKPSK